MEKIKNRKLFAALGNILVTDLVSLNVNRELSIITEEEFEEESKTIYEDKYCTDIIKTFAEIGTRQVLDLISLTLLEESIGKDNEEEINYSLIKSPSNNCLAVLTKDSIRVMKIIAMECDFIDAQDCKSLMKAGYEILDKYLCRTNSKSISLTLIQPNLYCASTCMCGINDFLKECEGGLLE